MENVLGNLYCIFNSFFGEYIQDYLWGLGWDCDAFSNANKFNLFGIIALAISLFAVILYYYVINHPRSRWWNWLITLIVVGVANLFIGYGKTASDMNNSDIPNCLMYEMNDDGEIIRNLITDTDCWGFGIANMIVSVIFFIVLSFILKWWSSNAKHSPII